MAERTLAERCPGQCFVPIAVILGGRWICREFWNSHAEQLTALVQFFSAMAIAEEAEVADTMKPARQNMEEEATDEFLGGK